MTTRREEWLDSFRKFLGRVFGRWFAPRHGWFFVTRRTVTSLMIEAARAGAPPKGYEIVSVDEAAAAVPGARVHRPEPGFPVLELPHGYVMGPKGHVAPTPQRVVAELSFGGPRIGDRAVLRESARAAESGNLVELPGVTANLAQDSFENYCHWLLQGFVRLDLLDRTVGFDRIDRFLVSPRPPAVLFEALERYGIDPARLYEVPDAPWTYRCEHLIAAGSPRRPGDAPRWVLDDVRARYGVLAASDAPRRIYLGRGRTRRRRVVNEPEVLDLLSRRGFDAVTMDGRTITEQAALLAGVECVVGAHGAALTNLVFAPPTATIIELTNKNWAVSVFRDLATTMGTRYASIDGVEPGLPMWLPRRRLIDADIVVDLDGLGRVLDDAGIR